MTIDYNVFFNSKIRVLRVKIGLGEVWYATYTPDGIRTWSNSPPPPSSDDDDDDDEGDHMVLRELGPLQVNGSSGDSLSQFIHPDQELSADSSQAPVTEVNEDGVPAKHFHIDAEFKPVNDRAAPKMVKEDSATLKSLTEKAKELLATSFTSAAQQQQ